MSKNALNDSKARVHSSVERILDEQYYQLGMKFDKVAVGVLSLLYLFGADFTLCMLLILAIYLFAWFSVMKRKKLLTGQLPLNFLGHYSVAFSIEILKVTVVLLFLKTAKQYFPEAALNNLKILFGIVVITMFIEFLATKIDLFPSKN